VSERESWRRRSTRRRAIEAGAAAPVARSLLFAKPRALQHAGIVRGIRKFSLTTVMVVTARSAALAGPIRATMCRRGAKFRPAAQLPQL
jgi:hypothetical protein